jgi:hypothetical protein
MDGGTQDGWHLSPTEIFGCAFWEVGYNGLEVMDYKTTLLCYNVITNIV